MYLDAVKGSLVNESFRMEVFIGVCVGYISMKLLKSDQLCNTVLGGGLSSTLKGSFNLSLSEL